MKKIFLSLLVLLAPVILSAQMGTEWEHVVVRPWSHAGYLRLAPDADGNIYISQTDSLAPSYAYIVKLDPLGMPVWRTYIAEGEIMNLTLHPAGFLLAGVTVIDTGGGLGVKYYKIRPDGTVVASWEASAPPYEYDVPADFSICADGDILLEVNLNALSDNDMRLTRLDTNFSPVWDILDTISNTMSDYGFLREDESGNILHMYNIAYPGDGYYHGVVEKRDPMGTLLWGPLNVPGPVVTHMNLLPGNSLVYLAFDTILGIDPYPFHLVKLDSNGVPLWDNASSPPGKEVYSYFLETDSLGGAYTAGMISDSAGGDTTWHFYASGFDNAGNRLWLFDYPGSFVSECQPWQALLGPDGFLYLGGAKDYCTSAGSGSIMNGSLLLKLDPATGTLVDQFEKILPCGTVYQMYDQRITFSPAGDMFFTAQDFNGGGSASAITYIAKLCSGCTPGSAGFTGLRGNVHLDLDADCTADSTEPGYYMHTVNITPGPDVRIPDMNGLYGALLDPGTYTLSHTPPPLWTDLCSTGSVNVTLDSVTPFVDHLDIHVAPAVIATDMRAYMFAGPARPGFYSYLYLMAYNEGTTITSGTAQLTLDPNFSFLASVPPPTSVTGSTVEWAFTGMNPFDGQDFTLQLLVDASAVIGTPYTLEFEVIPSTPDTFPVNNTVIFHDTIRGSIDPNAKYVSPSDSLSATDKTLTYSIAFQNTGTDTAFTVIVRDTIDPDLDLTTFRMNFASHPCTVSLQGRCLTWTFDHILLPDSNTNEPASHGTFQDAIDRVSGLPLAAEYSNRADIYFDYNLPVLTNTVRSVQKAVYVSAPELAHSQQTLVCYPNPVQDELHIALQGTGPMHIELWNTQGQLMMQAAAAQDAVLSLSALPAGVYLLRAKREGGWQTQRVVRW